MRRIQARAAARAASVLSLVGALCWLSAAAWSASPQADRRADVVFAREVITTFGDSVYVLGDRPELGGGDLARAIKLEPGAYPTWAATISLPTDIDFAYQYYLRADAPELAGDPTNGSPIGGIVIASTPPSGTPEPVRKVSLAAPTDYTFLRVVDFAGVDRAQIDFESAGDRVVALDAPFAPSDTLVVDSVLDSVVPVAIETNAQLLYLESNARTGTWNLPSPVPPSPARIVLHSNFASTNLGNSRTIRVYLPRGYESPDSANRRHPVLYMHDGQNVFAPGGPFGSWDVDLSATAMIAAGEIPELIIVGIDNTSDRLTEYVPPYSTLFNQQGRGDLYAAFVIDEVAPFIDANYRTVADREHRIVGGSSLGGLISAYMGWEFPAFANSYLCMSSSFQIDEIIDRFASQPARDIVLYLDSGNAGGSNDGFDNTYRARDTLLAGGKYVLNRNLFHTVGFGDQHNEAAWRRRFPATLKTVFTNSDLVTIRDDINGDCGVDVADLVTQINQRDTGLALPAVAAGRADPDGSGVVDAEDTALVIESLLRVAEIP